MIRIVIVKGVIIMISAQEARKITQGAHPEELRHIEDTIKKAAEMHMTCCIIKEEISEAAEQVLKTAGYKVQILSLHSGYITYINWAKE